MILKQVRLSRLLSQEQLAQMSGLSVRTIQRIESGQKPSLESLKCLASALDVDISTLTQDQFNMDRTSNTWQQLPAGLKWLFAINLFSFRPRREAVCRAEFVCHVFGFLFCALGLFSEPALPGGLMLLANAHFIRLHVWLGDRYGVWYDRLLPGPSSTPSV